MKIIRINSCGFEFKEYQPIIIVRYINGRVTTAGRFQTIVNLNEAYVLSQLQPGGQYRAVTIIEEGIQFGGLKDVLHHSIRDTDAEEIPNGGQDKVLS